MNERIHTWNMGYAYDAILLTLKEKHMPHAKTRVVLKDTLVNERSQSHSNHVCVTPLI